MAENLLTKVWALDFASHTWTVEGSNEPAGFTSPNAKYVALTIARASLANGACWASQKTIAATTGLSKNTVGRALAELESAGFITRVGRRRADGGRSTDKLWLTLPEVVLAAESVPSQPHRFLPGQGDEVDDDEPPTPKVVHKATPGRRGAPPTVVGEGKVTEGDLKEGSLAGSADPHPTDDFSTAVEFIWKAASDQGRRRSSKADIDKALRAARARGHAMETILRGLGAYFASDDATKDGGAFQRGAHVMLASDRFLSFLDDPGRSGGPPPPQAVQDAVGSLEAPSLARQRLWVELFAQQGRWEAARGPEPGQLGCRIDPSILADFGFAVVTQPTTTLADDESAAFD